jgi:Domain of unknown function (DUF4430)
VRPRLRFAAAAATAAAAAGCGLGAGPASKGTATLTITRDYGARRLATASETDPASSETVLRLLDRNAQITTRYGGGFVQSIDGLGGTAAGDRRFDWFFYVNGIESPVGATQATVHGGDRVWWDYRDWSAAMRVPAVVGSFPEPFLHGFQGRRWPVTVVCLGGMEACRIARGGLAAAGVEAAVSSEPAAGGGGARILVGPWAKVRSDPVGSLLAQPPEDSGVFAQLAGAGNRTTIGLLDQTGQRRLLLGPALTGHADAGLVAALRPGGGPPTWVITGTDARGVALGAGALSEAALGDRYAIVTTPSATPDIALPLPAGGLG